MEKILKLSREFMTIGKKYKVRCIKTKKLHTDWPSMDFYEIKDDTGAIQNLPSMMFRDLNKQELRAITLRELGI